MSEQERELFERRTAELAQARAALDDQRRKYSDVMSAMSHVMHEMAAKDARVSELAEVMEARKVSVQLQTELDEARDRIAELEHDVSAALNAQEAAEKEVFALRARVSELEAKLRKAATHAAERRKQATDMLGKLPTERSARARDLYMTADEYDGSMNERYELAEEFERLLGDVNDKQAASNPPATPGVDESGEPAAYDVAARRQAYGVGDRVRCKPIGVDFEIAGVVREMKPVRALGVEDDGTTKGGFKGVLWHVWAEDVLEVLPRVAETLPPVTPEPEVTDDVARKVEWAMAGGVLEPVERDHWMPWKHRGDGDVSVFLYNMWNPSVQKAKTRAAHCGPCRLRPAGWEPKGSES
jgi:polyhydroxyalkanoate synthesis regulator phasin